MLPPFDAVPQAVVTPSCEITSLILPSYNFAAVKIVITRYAEFLICDPCERVGPCQRGLDPQVEKDHHNLCLRL